MDQLDLWLLVAVSLAILFLVAVAFMRARSVRHMVGRVSAATAGRYEVRQGTSILGGTPFACELVGGGRTPLQWQVSVAVESGARFQVTPKSFSSRIGHAIGFALIKGVPRAVLTGDADFDGRFFLVCDSADTGRRLFASPRNRDAARRILDRRYLALVHDGEAVTTWVRVTDPNKFAPGTVTDIVPFLGELAAAIREHARPVQTPEPAHIVCPRRAALSASVLFLVAAVAGYVGYVQYPVLDDWQFALASLSVSLPVAVLVAVLALRAPNGTELLGYLVGVLVALPLVGWWGSGWLNGYLDQGQPAVHVVHVVDKYTTGDQYPYTYYVTLASWRPDRQGVTLSDERLYGVVQRERSLVAVTTMPGFFGFEWIHSAVNRGPAP